MSTSLFQVTEHVISCQYIREYPHAQKFDENPLRLAIKEYPPLRNGGESLAGSITFIATHANRLANQGMNDVKHYHKKNQNLQNAPQAYRFERKHMSLYGMIYINSLAINFRPFGLQTAPTKALAECWMSAFRVMIVGDAPRSEKSAIDHLIRTQPFGSTIPEIYSAW